MRYWWVNHKQTFRQEIDGGYLWSPKRTKNNRRSQFYDNMREARPGDRVISFADATIQYIGRITAAATEAPKPSEYGPAGENWNNVGWRLPVEWKPLPTPIRPKANAQSIRQWLPAKYSPIRTSGDGNQGAYLSEIRGDLFNFVVALGGGEPTAPPTGPSSSVTETRLPYDPPAGDTEREQISRARIGQGLFRTRVRDFEKSCRLTGIASPRLLVASHIKPWRASSSYERLDGANGLLLTRHVDHLFDKGFITFEDNGSVTVSSRLPEDDLLRLGLAGAVARNGKPFAKEQLPYLSYHRSEVFQQPAR